MRQRGAETHFVECEVEPHLDHDTACGLTLHWHWVTHAPDLVTCRNCKRTKTFRKALVAKERRPK